MKKKTWWITIGAVGIVYAGVVTYHQYKPLPAGISIESPVYEVENVAFYRDETVQDGDEQRVDQEIFDRIDGMIDEAESFVVVDLFMINGLLNEDLGFPEIADQLTDSLVEKKQAAEEMEIVVITDKVNTGYSSYESEWLEELKDADVEVVITELNPLRDPTPLYSGVWRIGIQWFGQEGTGWLPNAFTPKGPDMTARSYLELANIKANHRKVIITDQSAMVSSANAHTESGFHSNVAFEVEGPIIQDMLDSEQAIIDLGDSGIELPAYEGSDESSGEIAIQYVTEGKVLTAVVEQLDAAQEGDTVRMAMFYLAERSVVNALIDAANRGADVQLLLDPNETAFGSKKTGLPNRPVVNEIRSKTDNAVEVRWYNVKEEQFHPKMMMVTSADETVIISGSSNFTKRNLKDYNLESDLVIKAPNESDVAVEVTDYFTAMWENDGGEYTLDVDEYQDTLTFFQRGIYAFQKFFGFTTY